LEVVFQKVMVYKYLSLFTQNEGL